MTQLQSHEQSECEGSPVELRHPAHPVREDVHPLAMNLPSRSQEGLSFAEKNDRSHLLHLQEVCKYDRPRWNLVGASNAEYVYYNIGMFLITLEHEQTREVVHDVYGLWGHYRVYQQNVSADVDIQALRLQFGEEQKALSELQAMTRNFGPRGGYFIPDESQKLFFSWYRDQVLLWKDRMLQETLQDVVDPTTWTYSSLMDTVKREVPAGEMRLHDRQLCISELQAIVVRDTFDVIDTTYVHASKVEHLFPLLQETIHSHQSLRDLALSWWPTSRYAETEVPKLVGIDHETPRPLASFKCAVDSKRKAKTYRNVIAYGQVVCVPDRTYIWDKDPNKTMHPCVFMVQEETKEVISSWVIGNEDPALQEQCTRMFAQELSKMANWALFERMNGRQRATVRASFQALFRCVRTMERDVPAPHEDKQ